MTEPIQRLPEKIIKILKRPMPPESIGRQPNGLSSVKAIYISERLSEAFGIGRWHLEDVTIRTKPSIVLKAKLVLLDYPWFEAWAYGGNDNYDLGDAYKGALSDCLSKIAATYLNVALEVYKGQAAPMRDLKLLTGETINDRVKLMDIATCIEDLDALFKEGVRLASKAKDVDAMAIFTKARDQKLVGL